MLNKMYVSKVYVLQRVLKKAGSECNISTNPRTLEDTEADQNTTNIIKSVDF